MHEDIDFGNLTSKEIGTLMTKTPMERKKELAEMLHNGQEVDYGDLPSRALTTLGKMVVKDHQID